MLPTHRTMKNGRGDFYSDDKYDKVNSKNKGFRKILKNKVLLGVGVISLCALYYFKSQQSIHDSTLDTSTDTFKQPNQPAPDYGPIVDGPKPVIPKIIEDTEADIFEDDDFEQQQEEQEPILAIQTESVKPDQVNYKSFLFTQHPPPETLQPQDEKTAYRQKKIVDAFRHAWKGYSQDAFGKDEYQPLSHGGHNWAPGGVGLMIIDSLDTIMLMNLTEEYNQAREWIATELDFNKEQDVNVFETTIRVLGGLLSAYHLSNNDPLYLEKAVDLGDRLLYAFDSPTGIPFSGVVLSNGMPKSAGSSSTAEATTIQLEFKYLSHLTGDMKYWQAAEKVMDIMDKLVKENTGAIDGLVPIYIDAHSGKFASREIRLGSRGDSYYEYLLKQYLQTDKTEIKYRERYDQAVDGIQKHLIQYSYPNNLMYIAELMDSAQPMNIHPKMDHLVCFMGGSFILGVTEGAHLDELDPLDKKDSEDYYMAKEITRTCYEMYNMTATGLASEIVYFNTNEHSQPTDADMEIHMRDKHNLLRPETLESLFLMYRITGDEIYREWGWKIFEAFEKYTKLPEGGYHALRDCTTIPPVADNRMDTFFLAETLKYLYLLFSPNDVLPLTNYVLNTEAHPLPVFTPK